MNSSGKVHTIRMDGSHIWNTVSCTSYESTWKEQNHPGSSWTWALPNYVFQIALPTALLSFSPVLFFIFFSFSLFLPLDTIYFKLYIHISLFLLLPDPVSLFVYPYPSWGPMIWATSGGYKPMVLTLGGDTFLPTHFSSFRIPSKRNHRCGISSC